MLQYFVALYCCYVVVIQTLTHHIAPGSMLLWRALAGLAFEGHEQMLTQLLWNIILQVCLHEQLESLVIDRLRAQERGGGGSI